MFTFLLLPMIFCLFSCLLTLFSYVLILSVLQNLAYDLFFCSLLRFVWPSFFALYFFCCNACSCLLQSIFPPFTFFFVLFFLCFYCFVQAKGSLHFLNPIVVGCGDLVHLGVTFALETCTSNRCLFDPVQVFLLFRRTVSFFK